MSVAQEPPIKLSKSAATPSTSAERPLVRLPPSADGAHAGAKARAGSCFLGIRVSALLLALGSGIAFRNKPGEASSVAIVRGRGRRKRGGIAGSLAAARIVQAIEVLDGNAARKGFRLGKFDLVIEPGGKGGFQYRYDPARPESVLARAEVDDALQCAAGRKDVLATSVVTSSEPGSRYIDFLIPGIVRA